MDIAALMRAADALINAVLLLVAGLGVVLALVIGQGAHLALAMLLVALVAPRAYQVKLR